MGEKHISKSRIALLTGLSIFLLAATLIVVYYTVQNRNSADQGNLPQESPSVQVKDIYSNSVDLAEDKTPSDLPALSANIRVTEIHADCVELTWEVENVSTQHITFDENQIMQVNIDGQIVPCPTEARTISIGEQVSFDFELNNVDTDKLIVAKITATANDGTTVTFRKSIIPPREDEDLNK